MVYSRGCLLALSFTLLDAAESVDWVFSYVIIGATLEYGKL